MHRLLVLSAWLLLQPRVLHAQSGVELGSSAAAFGTGVSVARDADAIFWNPALIGLQPFSDVRSAPTEGLRLLGVSVRAAASRAWASEAARLGLFDGGSRGAPGWARLFSPGGGGDGATADLVWISSATRTLGVAVSSHLEARGGLEPPAAVDSVNRAAWSTALAALSGPAGRVFGVRARAGMTVKARWVHVHGAGGWPGSEGSGPFFHETTVRGVAGGSADVGVVLQPGELVISGALSDVVRITDRPRRGARVRTVSRDDSGELHETDEPVDETNSAPQRAAAEDLYLATVPPGVARLGMSWASGWGEPAIAVEQRIRRGGLAPIPATTWSASFRTVSHKTPVRLGVSGGSGSLGWGLGWIAPGCRFPWAASLGRTRRARGEAVATAFSVAFGSRSSRACSGRD